MNWREELKRAVSAITPLFLSGLLGLVAGVATIFSIILFLQLAWAKAILMFLTAATFAYVAMIMDYLS